LMPVLQHPTPPVSPYTTLFRSEEPVQAAHPEENSDETDSAGDGGEPEYDPMPQSSLSQNEAPVDGADSDFLVGQPPIGYQIYERSEEHTSELQSRFDLVCSLLL